MDKDEVKLLARAINLWLQYKKLCGFEHLMGEAMLTLAVAEYLNGQGWRLRAEQDLLTIAPEMDVSAGCLNFDLCAARGDVNSPPSCIFELKYLKRPRKGKGRVAVGSSERVTDDIFKLSYPINPNMKRYLIIAGEKDVEIQGGLRSILTGSRRTVHVRYEQAASQLEPSFQLSESMAKLALGREDRPQSISVECFSEECPADSDMHVAIYQVLRA